MKPSQISSKYFPRLALVGVLLAGANLFAQTVTNVSAPSFSMTPDKTPPSPELLMWRKEFGATHEQRMQWWRAARFGMFIHWGVYSVPAGVWQGKEVNQSGGEWIMNRGRIPVADYQNFTKQFAPTNFNAEQWVKIAKDAGMKYIVITAKHHDGFAMFHSQASAFNIYDATPWHRDPLAELAAACKKKVSNWDFIIRRRRTGIIRAVRRRAAKPGSQ
jgi:hypothetical protein